MASLMDNISNRYIEEEMKNSYLDYSMSVIVSRALPDVRDGMKPVHRRVLYAMNELGMTNDKPYKKCARIVGEVLGKYHPHGDSSVYGTVVRMAQDFNYRYTLVEGHGNFGTIDGDQAAAMRYTEARMEKITAEMLEDIDKATVDWRRNFDDTLDEPTVLPAKLPNLLVNGAIGIAVGMATNIPTHNLGEVVDGTIAYIDNPEISVPELVQYIKGPDFPTGAVIEGSKGIMDAYTTGRGKIKVRAKYHVEEESNGTSTIIITELPYQLNKRSLVEHIDQLHKDGRLPEIKSCDDYSNIEGIKIVIVVKKGESPEIVMNKLFKLTELQTTFGVIMLAIVDNAPKILTLKDVLQEYVKHRFGVITRRVKFDLDKAEKRAHLLQGFQIALDNIDRVIELIRGSQTAEIAKNALMEKFAFTEVQAKAILDMRLQRLTGLEREKVDAELAELVKLIADLRDILANDSRIYQIMKTELLELKEKYGDERKTAIEGERAEISHSDLIKDEQVIITLTNKGYVKRMEVEKYKAQKRGGKGVSSQNTLEDDFVEYIQSASTLDSVMVFTNHGRAFSINVYEIPESSKQSRGKLIGNIVKLRENEKIQNIVTVSPEHKDKEIIFVTQSGLVKKTKVDQFKNINASGVKAIKLRDGDNIIFVGLLTDIENNEILIATKDGYAVRFKTNDQLRPSGRDTMGVKGLSLRDGDEVVSAVILGNSNETLLTVTENGYGKRTSLDEYPLHSRGGKGVINLKTSEKTGNVVDVSAVIEGDEVIAISSSGIVIRTSAIDISQYSRAAQGVRIMRVTEGETLVSIAIVSGEEEKEKTDVANTPKETSETNMDNSSQLQMFSMTDTPEANSDETTDILVEDDNDEGTIE